jgi:hypothetical protein
VEDLIEKKRNKDEELWNRDLIQALEERLTVDFPDVKVIKGKVLKDIFLYKDKSCKYSLQFGFVDQDIIIYQETMDISDLQASRNVLLHNNYNTEPDRLIIPRIICELKYNGINSHSLVIYSEYAADIKSIFPDCKYYLALRYKKSSTPNKLYRHGKHFDKIIAFENGKQKGKYNNGDFINNMSENKDLEATFNEFVDEIKKTLKVKKTYFIK